MTEFSPSINHGYTPSGNPFANPDHCIVQLYRYPCPWPREAHDPALPSEDVDCFGRRRLREVVPPPDRSGATRHHPGVAELHQIAGQSSTLTKSLLRDALRDALALLDAETEAHARTGRAMAEWAARAGAAEVHAEAERKRADHAEAALRPGRRC